MNAAKTNKLVQANNAAHTCRLCSNSVANTAYQVREMLFGYRDCFTYFACSNCGCLQIAVMPDDIARYYPPTYVSYVAPFSAYETVGLRKYLKRIRLNHWLGERTLLGHVLTKMFGPVPVSDYLLKELVGRVNLTAESRIMDVGCGNGQRLFEWNQYGFTDLTGIDPYVPQGLLHPNGVKIIKADLSQLTVSGDFVVLNHSLEHMWDQLGTLQSVNRLLPPGGFALVAIPICSSFAWEHYRTNWVALDAPRHFYLHSVQSMTSLAQRAGFTVEAAVYNSTDLQFWASESYARDIPLTDPSDPTRWRPRGFSDRELEYFKERADDLNREGRGDTASFYLRKVPDIGEKSMRR